MDLIICCFTELGDLNGPSQKSNVVASAHVTEHVDDSKTQPKILQLRKDTVSYCFLILKTVTIKGMITVTVFGIVILFLPFSSV